MGFWSFAGATTSGATVRSANLSLTVSQGVPAPAVLQAPSNLASGVDRFPQLSWSAVSGASQYRVELAAGGNFAAPLIDTMVSLNQLAVTTALQANTAYSWRVTASSPCGNATPSSTFSFTTGSALCSSQPLIIPDNSPGGVSRSFNLGSDGRLLTDLDVSAMITHSYVGDLSLRLRREASGTDVLLIDRPGVPASANGCSGDNIDVTLDDEAASPVESQCAGGATTINGRFRPNNPLSAFDGLQLAGSWTLTVSDSVAVDTGNLTRFCFLPALAAGSQIFHNGFESATP